MSMRYGDLAGTRVDSLTIPHVAAAALPVEYPCPIDNRAGRGGPRNIQALYLVPGSTATGRVTDQTTFQLINKGLLGSGTSVIASLIFSTAVTLVDMVRYTVSGALDYELAEDAQLACVYADAGSGIAVPSLMWEIHHRPSFDIGAS